MFTRTHEPVGSKALQESIDSSSATIRNDMAKLEKMGYLEKNHTSSGRVPSNKGYEFYINNLLDDKNLSIDEIKYINSKLKDNIFDFRLKWGIIDVISNDEILELFGRHTAGKQDLDSTGRISQLKKDARKEYQVKAQDKEVAALNKITYGNELVAALYKFADSYVNER